MAINLYDFHDIIRETYNEYVSRYEIDLVDFKNEYGTDSEPKFIEYQRIYLVKMRDYIIENLSKIDSEDLDSQFYHDKLQEALSDNKKMFHFLNVRLNPMNYTPEPKENASKGIVTSFLDNLNDGRFDKSDMIDFIESRSTIEKLETLIEGIENYIINYNTGKAFNNWKGFQFDEAFKRPLSKESFSTFKELVLSKIDELKNFQITSNTKADVKEKDNTKMPWFIVGKNIANGKIQELIDEKLSKGKIAEELGLKYSDAPHISKSMLFRPCRGEKSRNNIFNYPEKIIEIYNHCINNGITVVPEFEEIALKHI